MYKTGGKRTKFTRLIIILIILAGSCSRQNPDHPQAEKESAGVLLNKQQILNYKDSVNGLIGQLNKQQTLIYTLGDNSFYITRYSSNGEPLLYIKKSKNNEYDSMEERYYVHNNHLVLYSKNSREITSGEILSEQYFFRNNILFYSKSGQSDNDHTVPDTVIKEEREEKTADLKQLEQALNQTGKFNLVFDGIADYPQARYLILSRNELHAYRAALLMENEDELAEELISNPEKYKGRKLDLKWKIRNGEEAVYISGRLHR